MKIHFIKVPVNGRHEGMRNLFLRLKNVLNIKGNIENRTVKNVKVALPKISQVHHHTAIFAPALHQEYSL